MVPVYCAQKGMKSGLITVVLTSGCRMILFHAKESHTVDRQMKYQMISSKS